MGAAEGGQVAMSRIPNVPGSARLNPSCILFLSVLMTALTGCGDGQHETPIRHHSVLERLSEENDPNDNAGLRSDRWLEGVRASRVRGMDLGEADTFLVENRTHVIERFPCGECHTVPLASMKSPDTTKKRAHWELELHHASGDVMSCMTCHTPDRMDSLSLLQGGRVSFDESYRLCAGCHSSQAKDWIGGAHGKRVGGWAPPRVIANCASCHNPHDPSWKPRFPARSSRVAEE